VLDSVARGAGSRRLIVAGIGRGSIPFFLVNVVGGGTIVLLFVGSAKEIHGDYADGEREGTIVDRRRGAVVAAAATDLSETSNHKATPFSFCRC